MATQATTKHAEAKAKQHAQACMILQRAYDKAMRDDLKDSDLAKYMQIYLSKTLPDLKAVEHSGETTTHVTGVDIKIIG